VHFRNRIGTDGFNLLASCIKESLASNWEKSSEWKRFDWVDIGLDLVNSNYMPGMPCNATELVHFRKRIGVEGFNLIFRDLCINSCLKFDNFFEKSMYPCIHVSMYLFYSLQGNLIAQYRSP
jgi:hypothetical protein